MGFSVAPVLTATAVTTESVPCVIAPVAPSTSQSIEQSSTESDPVMVALRDMTPSPKDTPASPPASGA